MRKAAASSTSTRRPTVSARSRWPKQRSTGSESATDSTSHSSTEAPRSYFPDLLAVFREKGLEVRGTPRAVEAAGDGVLPHDRERLGYEWANEPDRVATVTLDLVVDLADAVRIANEETSGLAAGIVTEDAEAANCFLDGYRGTAAFWHATTRFTDGFELTGAPETGINVDAVPGPRGPVTYRDLWLRQYQVVGDGTQTR